MMSIHTYSIVAHCAEEDAWGVAVASKFPAVGAVVPWARAGAGAVATQSYAKLGYGPDGLALMGEGLSAAEALSRLLDADEGRGPSGGASGCNGRGGRDTGGECHEWAGHQTGLVFCSG